MAGTSVPLGCHRGNAGLSDVAQDHRAALPCAATSTQLQPPQPISSAPYNFLPSFLVQGFKVASQRLAAIKSRCLVLFSCSQEQTKFSYLQVIFMSSSGQNRGSKRACDACRRRKGWYNLLAPVEAASFLLTTNCLQYDVSPLLQVFDLFSRSLVRFFFAGEDGDGTRRCKNCVVHDIDCTHNIVPQVSPNKPFL